MKIFRIFMLIPLYLLIMSGCEKSPQKQQEQAEKAYAAFLSGDISMFDSSEKEMWALDVWTDTILPYGGLEYTYLDLDGDSIPELLVQYENDPCIYNGVFHYSGRKLYCWQNDFSEGSSRDYPLKDGTMVHQYKKTNVIVYEIFRYNSDGEPEQISHLMAFGNCMSDDTVVPEHGEYITYEGEVDYSVFVEKLNETVMDKILDRSAWTAID